MKHQFENFNEAAFAAANVVAYKGIGNSKSGINKKEKHIELCFSSLVKYTFCWEKGMIKRIRLTTRKEALEASLYFYKGLQIVENASVCVIEQNDNHRFITTINDVEIAVFAFKVDEDILGSIRRYRPLKEAILEGKHEATEMDIKLQESGTKIANDFNAFVLPEDIKLELSLIVTTVPHNNHILIANKKEFSVKSPVLTKKRRKHMNSDKGGVHFFNDTRFDHDD